MAERPWVSAGPSSARIPRFGRTSENLAMPGTVIDRVEGQRLAEAEVSVWGVPVR